MKTTSDEMCIPANEITGDCVMKDGIRLIVKRAGAESACVELSVDPTTTVGNLKCLVEYELLRSKNELLPPERQRLIFAGRMLSSDEELISALPCVKTDGVNYIHLAPLPKGATPSLRKPAEDKAVRYCSRRHPSRAGSLRRESERTSRSFRPYHRGTVSDRRDVVAETPRSQDRMNYGDDGDLLAQQEEETLLALMQAQATPTTVPASEPVTALSSSNSGAPAAPLQSPSISQASNQIQLLAAASTNIQAETALAEMERTVLLGIGQLLPMARMLPTSVYQALSDRNFLGGDHSPSSSAPNSSSSFRHDQLVLLLENLAHQSRLLSVALQTIGDTRQRLSTPPPPGGAGSRNRGTTMSSLPCPATLELEVAQLQAAAAAANNNNHNSVLPSVAAVISTTMRPTSSAVASSPPPPSPLSNGGNSGTMPTSGGMNLSSNSFTSLEELLFDATTVNNNLYHAGGQRLGALF